MPLPNLIIAGCQKCGTTWLHASLGKSAQIFGSATKELTYFNKRDFRDHEAGYRAHFPETPGAVYYMESTPHYFQLPNPQHDIAASIRATLPDVKILLMFRDPVARYESAYIHHIMKGRLPYVPEIDTFTDQEKLLTFGHYADILTHWHRIFPDPGIYLYDDLVADRSGLIGRVMAHLGLPNDITPAALDFRTNDKQIKRQKLTEAWDVMPHLTPRLAGQLRDYYAPGVLRFETMIGRDLSKWKS